MAIVVAEAAGAFALGAVSGLPRTGELDGPIEAAFLFFVLSSGMVGALIVSRLRRHPVGWLLLLATLAYATGGLVVSYLEVAFIVRPGSLPVSPFLVWLGDWAFGLGAGLSATFVLLLFPTGRLPSRRWRPVAWLAGIAIVSVLVGVALSPRPFEGLSIDNPLELEESDPLLLLLEGGGLLILLATIVASVASLVFRYRRASGEERQQLKWVAFSVMLLGLGVLGTVGWEVANGPSEVSDEFENLITTLLLGLVPVSIGVAILRYRLYDVDLVINRTLVYGSLTVLLGAVYVAGVVGLPRLLPLAEDNDLVVAGSTLGVAALFSPLRRRLQRFVDRRFYRARYDARTTVEAFAARLREEVDLDQLRRDLVGVVQETLQPASVSVWLREGVGR
ncbi:MAG: hypothetical protein ACRDWX_01510 [Acidimicrobiia bacterium]